MTGILSGGRSRTRLKDDGTPLTVAVGMHRSGTSVLTHILCRAGHFAGEGPDLIRGGKWNRDGYFERWSVLRTNNFILSLAGGSWHSPPPQDAIAGIRLDNEIASLLNAYHGRDPAVLKDPRICLTFPVWKRALGKGVRFVHITRDPEDVAASLTKRDGFSREKGIDLQCVYEKRAAEFLKGYRVYSMRYEDLFSPDRGRVLRGLSSFLDSKADLEEIAEQVVDATLYHHRQGKTDRSGGLARHAPDPEPENAVLRQNPERLEANAQSLGGARDSSKGLEAAKSGPWWDYGRFKGGSVRVLLVSLRHLLLGEMKGALERLGHPCRVMMINGTAMDRDMVEEMFTEAIREFHPDFVLTVNHLGFDHEGTVTDLLTRFRIPFASWYVDSPHLIIHHYRRNRSPFLSLFMWDRDYVDVVKKLGFERAEYLPLGVDETLFRPVAPADNPLGSLENPVSFVGNSMVMKVRSMLSRNNINGSLIGNFEAVSSSFEKTDHLIVREMMAQKYPELERDLRRLSHAQALGYEAAVTWQATGSYRAHRVRMLEGFNPLVVGDRGWKDLLGRGFQLHSELNYYGDLSNFYNMSRISFNATSRQMKNGVNQRVFDVPACRGVVITDRTRQLEDLMEPGRDLLAYGSAEEIPDLVGRCLDDGRFHGKIAESGYRRVLDEHTYVKRVEKLVAAMRRDHA